MLQSKDKGGGDLIKEQDPCMCCLQRLASELKTYADGK